MLLKAAEQLRACRTMSALTATWPRKYQPANHLPRPSSAPNRRSTAVTLIGFGVLGLSQHRSILPRLSALCRWKREAQANIRGLFCLQDSGGGGAISSKRVWSGGEWPGLRAHWAPRWQRMRALFACTPVNIAKHRRFSAAQKRPLHSTSAPCPSGCYMRGGGAELIWGGAQQAQWSPAVLSGSSSSFVIRLISPPSRSTCPTAPLPTAPPNPVTGAFQLRPTAQA
ncbi:hypothetical protein SKAU_G00044870 [Synaphobranchus kaupii]|uniref:Uncharacterized protein n=1 Tax=Synaphobranchus kaupii TaxID=118154 RepID=A0A9Q1J966_SYNKA|nr:hypothetical protein SKAU_G00044870 [Synaphobranchus kaupii]